MLALLPALVLFAFVGSITPGPNNVMLMSSGVNFGFLRTVPHLMGVSLGFGLMVVLVGLGLAEVFVREPRLLVGLKWVGAAYLVYLAVRIARSGPLTASTGRTRPLTFLEAAAFQWVNPKAWMFAVTACATYSVATAPTVSVLVIAAVIMAVGLPCTTAWVGFGSGMRRALSRPRVLVTFNVTMAMLLIASLYPLVTE